MDSDSRIGLDSDSRIGMDSDSTVGDFSTPIRERHFEDYTAGTAAPG